MIKINTAAEARAWAEMVARQDTGGLHPGEHARANREENTRDGSERDPRCGVVVLIEGDPEDHG